MAYYPPELVERIRLIKLLQEERFMPLKVIRELLEREATPSRRGRVVELADRISTRARPRARAGPRAPRSAERLEVPAEALDRLAELGVLSPAADGYSPSDVRIVEAIARFRAGGYDERIGFTVYDALRFLEPLEALARARRSSSSREARRADRARAGRRADRGRRSTRSPT